MFLVVFIDGKSDRFADLPYSAATKMASARVLFRPDQSTISTKIMAKTLTNNEKLFARISGNRCSYMDWHKNIGLVKFALDSSNLNVVRRFTHLLYMYFCKWTLLFRVSCSTVHSSVLPQWTQHYIHLYFHNGHNSTLICTSTLVPFWCLFGIIRLILLHVNKSILMMLPWWREG
jgi:hypothetical protein